jgi:hypothetical protein
MIERLTVAQKGRMRKAHRAAFAEPDQVRALNEFFSKFMDLYGVSTDTLRDVIEADKQRHPAEYRALQAIHDSQKRVRPRKQKSREHKTFCPVCAKNLEVSSGPLPPHENRNGDKCRGAGKWGVSQLAARNRKKQKKRVVVRDNDRYYSTSVRTVGGGLPTLGRRR